MAPWVCSEAWICTQLWMGPGPCSALTSAPLAPASVSALGEMEGPALSAPRVSGRVSQLRNKGR